MAGIEGGRLILIVARGFVGFLPISYKLWQIWSWRNEARCHANGGDFAANGWHLVVVKTLLAPTPTATVGSLVSGVCSCSLLP